MTIKIIDVIDAICIGGFIDIETGKWIPPWEYTQLSEYNRSELSFKDYEAIMENPERYVSLPCIDHNNMVCDICAKIGIDKSVLIACGYDPTKHDHVADAGNRKDNNLCRVLTEQELKAADCLHDYLVSTPLYLDYIGLRDKYIITIGKEYLSKYGVEVEPG